MMRHVRRLMMNYALVEAGWMIISFDPARTELWARVTPDGIAMVRTPPRLRSFWYRPSFWHYVWEHWHD